MAQRTAPASQVPIVNIEALDTIDDGTFRITDQLTNDTKASGSEARGRGPDSNEDQTRSSGSIISESCYSIRSTRSYIRPYYRSRRVAKSEIEKPWIGERQNGEFEMTTNDRENVFLDNGKLVIKPTLQDPTLINTDYALLNLTADGTCTSDMWYSCWAATNATNHTIINPIKSGRINTKSSASIRYGRVEVVAKMPVGDWLWPAIWLLPVDNVYGPWPASGEIDMAESRGNNYTYKYGGNDEVSSSLHWGPTKSLDQTWRDTNTQKSMHSTYSAKFHTYGLEWSKKYLYTYVDSRIRHVIYTKYTKPQWVRGQFPQLSEGKLITDPWDTNRFNTPFDTPFYLIVNLAVGGTNGYFSDPDSNKPWVNNAVNASAYFWAAKDSWYPTWVEGKAQLEVESVKMWQECD
ncbi:related to gram-negative bacteria-binding protein 1 precursor [Rhynchosporium agropyri]|uniref:Related to gram-negative bacteria-binding protein 1 n=1 Tax=Rhynchosporium agropyri TaxID=914238 RepID=A0A1E1K7S7_9HELO|nr:related to gram-negative bacteria-binding protein 1 precursor [Rhynchosporium agropyri]